MKIAFAILLNFSALLLFGQDKAPSVLQLYDKGENAYRQSQYQEALKLLNACLQQDPAFAEAYFTRASVREQLKDLAGAHTDYSLYLDMRPEHAEALLARGTIRYKLGRYESAREDFSKLLTIPPGETHTILYQKSATPQDTRQIMTAQGAMKPIIYNYLGLTETKLKRFSAAKAWLDSAIRLESKEPDYYVNRGIVKEALGDTTALEDYKKALTLDPNHTLALHNLSLLRKKRGEKAAYEDSLEKAIASDSSMLYPYLERAYQRLEGGYYKGALEDYNDALRIESGDPEIWLNRGLVREKLNDLKGAYADYTKAIQLKENFAKAWLNRGNVLARQGRYKEAVEDYSTAITYQAGYGAAFYNRAIAREKLKQNDEACADVRQAEAAGTAVDSKLKDKVCPR